MQTRTKYQHSTFNIQYSLVLFLLFFIATAGNAVAGAWEFAPRYNDYSGAMVLKGMMTGRESADGNRSSSSQDLNFQEYLHTRASGYIYNQNLIRILSDVSIGLQQENREVDNLSFRQDNGMFGFRQDLLVLPNHPYNLHLYAARSDELLGSKTVGTSRAVIHQWGAQAQYQKRPWQTMLSYTHAGSESTWDSVTDNMTAHLYYFDTLKSLNINGIYNHYISSSYDDQINTVKDVFGAHIKKKWQSLRFLSRWDLDQHNQEARYQSLLGPPDYSDTRSRREWFNQLTADLPLNFTSRLSYRTRNTEAEHQRGQKTGGTSSDTDSYTLNFSHRLYKSLHTNLNSNYRIMESSGGKTEQNNARLGTDYTKLIRWGTFGAGLSGGISNTGNSGGTTTLSDQYFLTASSPTSFTLNSTQLSPETIRVSVIDSFNNDIIVSLIRNIHYQVIFLGESYRILVLNLPPSLSEPWSDYTYIVDYDNISSDYTIRGTDWGGTMRMSLFNQLLSPHTSYRQNNQQELNGFVPGLLDNSTSYDLGLSSTYGNVHGDISNYWKTSTTGNETRLTGYVTYSFNITDLTGGSCGVSYENGTIEQHSTSIKINELKLDEHIYSGHIQAHTSWLEKQLKGSLGANYSVYQGLGESSTKSINSGLSWQIGKLDLNLRISYINSESEVMTRSTSSDYYTVWLITRRELF